MDNEKEKWEGVGEVMMRRREMECREWSFQWGSIFGHCSLLLPSLGPHLFFFLAAFPFFILIVFIITTIAFFNSLFFFVNQILLMIPCA